MRLQVRTIAPLSMPDDVFAWPVSALGSWLASLPSPTVRSERAQIGEALRGRIREVELTARTYHAAQHAVARGDTWEGGPTVQRLQRLEQDLFGLSYRLREACADIGEPSDEICRDEGLLATALRRVTAALAAPELDVRVALVSLALAERAHALAWRRVIARVEEASLHELAEDLTLLARAAGGHSAVVERWLRSVARN